MKFFNIIFVFILLTTFAAKGQITGTPNVCVGSTTVLTCSSLTGGTWSSSNSSVATVDTFGVVTGISAATAIITYQLLPTIYTRVITVNPLPAPITGASFAVCEGSNITLSSASPYGTWATSESSIAIVDTGGRVTGLLAGTSIIQYALTATTCATNVIVTVNPRPSVIIGATSLCVGASTTLTNSMPGGIWSSSSSAVASISPSTGLVTGISAGTSIISYSSAFGCFRTMTILVNPLPAFISGGTNFCTGMPDTLFSSTSGGTWSSPSSIISVHPTFGIVTGLSLGAAIVSYTLSTGCFDTTTVYVSAMPSTIAGPSSVCNGATITLSNTVAGGIWSSDATSVATIGSATGTATVVTGVSPGLATIRYSTSSACAVSVILTVNPAPFAGLISGPSSVCPSSTIALSSTVIGGTWLSSTTAVATVSSAGVVTGISPGTSFITYTHTNSCGSAFAVDTITVGLAPTSIIGASSLCTGTPTTLLNGVSGGSWSSSDAAIASISTIGADTAIVSGIASGTVTITYTLPSGCYTTSSMTVNLTPSSVIGPDSVCVGAVIGLSDATSGGVWNSSTPAIATIGVIGASSGVVTGIAPGTVTITYSLGTCIATKDILVMAVPIPSTSSVADACGVGYTLTATGGGRYSWSPSSTLSCDTCATTYAIPAVTTTYIVTVTNALGCSATSSVDINADRIYGHITFSAAMPTTPSLRVWLIQFNPTDSSIIATDSLLSCLDGSSPYYQFSSKPSGNYMVKASLLSSIPGTSDYIPTYGSSTANWYEGTTVMHASGSSDAQDINMIFGTVPTGPGFISGYVYSGAGKGTAGEIPEVGMLVYLKDATTGTILTYTYTDASGDYSFSGVGLGNYTVYPAAFDYYTTAAVVSLTLTNTTATNIGFKKHTILKTIFPFVKSAVNDIEHAKPIVNLFPNPTYNIVNIECEGITGNVTTTIRDITGRIVYSNLSMSGLLNTVDVSLFEKGMYVVTVRGENFEESQKLIITAHN